MLKLNLSSPQDIMALLVRRKWWIILPFPALSCAALLFTYMLPRMYVSESLVQIQQRDIPDDFVKDLLAGSTDQRLSAVKQNVLRRSNLIGIVNEFEGSMPEYQKLDLEQKIAALNNQIELSPRIDDSIGNGRLPVVYFRIAYRNHSPAVAQKITAKLTDMFIAQDNQAREAKVNEATTFLSNELEKISSKLNESETKLKNLKARRRNSLPDQTSLNLNSLTRLGDQRKANSEAVDRSEAQLISLQQIIAATPPTITRSAPVPALTLTPIAKNPLVDDYLQTLAEKNALIAKGLTEKHPDVDRTTRHLESLKKQIPEDVLAAALEPKPEKSAAAAQAVISEENPNYQNLKITEGQLLAEIKIRKDALKDTMSEIERYTKRVEEAPESEQELAEVLRQNTDLNKQYEDMKNNLTKAQLSESLESNQQGSALQIAEPANLPLSATKPAKVVIAAAGIMASLLVGIFLAVIVDVANQKMWTLSDVETLLGTVVLVEIPEIVTTADITEAKRKRWIRVASLSVLSGAYGAGLYFVYIHQTFVLRYLEPVIKRLY